MRNNVESEMFSIATLYATYSVNTYFSEGMFIGL